MPRFEFILSHIYTKDNLSLFKRSPLSIPDPAVLAVVLDRHPLEWGRQRQMNLKKPKMQARKTREETF